MQKIIDMRDIITDSSDHEISIKANGKVFLKSGLSKSINYNKSIGFKYPNLQNITWAELDELVSLGLASTYYNVGDEKTITLTTGEPVTLQILGFNHDDLASGGKAGITFGMKHLLRTEYDQNYSYSTTSQNYFAWSRSLMRERLNAGEIFEILPTDLRNVAKSVIKKTTAGNKLTTTEETIDKFFLFSEVEIDGTTTTGYKNEGTQYEYWVSRNNNTQRIKKSSNGTGSADNWWLRSPYISAGQNMIRYVRNTGALNYTYSYSAFGVCFGFCV